MRFIIPWIAEVLKLSDPDFIANLYMPTVLGLRLIISCAIKFLRVVFEMAQSPVSNFEVHAYNLPIVA